MPSNDRVKAALKIQRYWRNRFIHCTTTKYLDTHANSGMTSEHAKSISFEALVQVLRDKRIIDITRNALQRVHLLTTFRHGSPSKALSPENVNVRVFLAGFMIAYRPTHVFENMGTLEQALFEAATPLIATFEKIYESFRERGSFAKVPHSLTKDFPTLLFEYLKKFKAWKVPDENKLKMRIKHALIALYQAEEHLPPDEPADSKLKKEFSTQIERLRSKLQQIGGVDALDRFDAERAAGHVHTGNPGNPPGGSSAYAALPGRLTNEQLAHELLLDPGFQLDESGGCSVENPVFHRIRESFHQAFWDSLVDDLKLEIPCYVRVLRVLCEISDGIKDLAGSRESGCLNEVVDLAYIRQRVENRAYAWSDCQQLVASIVVVIKRVQAPKRDNETKDKWDAVRSRMRDAPAEERPRQLCKALEFLLDRVNAMRIDAANARLRLIAPVIKDHGIDYERGKFQDKLTDGTLTLERTTAWIRSTVTGLVRERADVLESLLCGNAAAFIETHCDAVLSIITDTRKEVLPETMAMDAHRLQHMQTEFHFITAATASVVMMASESNAPAEVMQRVQRVLTEATDMDIAAEDIVMLVPAEEVRAKARASIARCMQPGSSVRQLMHTRVRKTLRTMVLTGSPPGDLRAEVRLMLPRITRIAQTLAPLCRINRTVHRPTYNKLIEEAVSALKCGGV